MTFTLYTNSISAHQLPLAREVAKRVGEKNFRYVHTDEKLQGGAQEVETEEPWVTKDVSSVENCDILLVGGIRPIDLAERRLAAGKMTLYMSERWFKPIPLIDFAGRAVYLPGWVRLLVPSYWRMARRFARFFKSPHYRFLPIGPWSLRDMKIVCRIMGVRMPSDQVIPWGDFVEPSDRPCGESDSTGAKTKHRVLWVGRMLGWKHVDAVIKAIDFALDRGVGRLSLCLVGDGSDRSRLERLAASVNAKHPYTVVFHPPMSLWDVRKLMRDRDLYVLASNSCEGWGAVVPEALEEGMIVLGTYEAGASAALLPKENLFHCGDWRTLAQKLMNISSCKRIMIPKDFTPAGAADRLLKAVG